MRVTGTDSEYDDLIKEMEARTNPLLDKMKEVSNRFNGSKGGWEAELVYLTYEKSKRENQLKDQKQKKIFWLLFS